MRTTHLTGLDEKALLARVDDLGNRMWECRRRGWTRKIEAVRHQLLEALRELGRRIEAERA